MVRAGDVDSGSGDPPGELRLDGLGHGAEVHGHRQRRGTLNGVPFSLSNFIITSFADTANRQDYGSLVFIDHTSSSIFIAGLGNFDILTGTRIVCEPHLSGGRFLRAGVSGTDLYDGPYNAAFTTWNMLTPVGPISGQAELEQWVYTPLISTSGGTLIFDDSPLRAATFTAVVAPEPATLSLLALGGAAVVARRRRKVAPTHESVRPKECRMRTIAAALAILLTAAAAAQAAAPWETLRRPPSTDTNPNGAWSWGRERHRRRPRLVHGVYLARHHHR